MPPSADPMVNPQSINVTRNDLCFSGQYSEVSVIAFGMAPPSPSPVRNRSAIRIVRLGLFGPERGRFFVLACTPKRAARSGGQHWPKATAEGGAQRC